MAYRIAIATDHGGFEGKNRLRDDLKADGHQVMDCGTYSSDSTDYPIFASRLAAAVSRGLVDYGILLCKSGIGMSMVANRFHGVRAALANSKKTAMMSRAHNNANVLVMGNDYMAESFKDVVDVFLSSDFEGGRHARRVGQIEMIDTIINTQTPNSQSLAHGQAVWTQNLLADDELSEFAPDNLRGYSITFQNLVELLESGDPMVSERLEGLVGRGASVDEMIEGLIEHEIVRTTEALDPMETFTRGEDGRIIVPVALESKSTGAVVLDRIQHCRERWSDFPVAWRIRTSQTGIDAAFRLLAEGQSVVLWGIESVDTIGMILDQFAEKSEQLSDTRACLYIMIDSAMATTSELAALLHAHTGFDRLGDAYERGIAIPIIIRTGPELLNAPLQGQKFMLSKHHPVTIKSEDIAFKQLREMLAAKTTG